MVVNIEKTKKYYDTLCRDKLCDCDYCKLFYSQAKELLSETGEWLEQYGIDVEKPFEVMSLEPDENGMLEYIGVQYVVLGNCEDNYECRMGDYAVRKAPSHPSTGIQEEHFILEVYPLNSMKLSVRV